MHLKLHGPLDATDFKRALDQILLLMIEQDITIVDDVHIHLDAWSGNEKVQFLHDDQTMSVRLVPTGEAQHWMACGNGKFVKGCRIPKKIVEPADAQEPKSSAI